MNLRRAAYEGIGLVALTIALTAALLSGVVAAMAFPLMKRLGPTLSEYAAYSEPHWRITAGHVAEPVFTVTLLVETACLILVLMVLALLMLIPTGPSRRAMAWRCGPVLLSVVALGLSAFVQYEMGKDLVVMRAAAKIGDMAAAGTASQAFSAKHGLSTGSVLAVSLFLVLSIVAWVPGLATQRTPIAKGGAA